MEAAIMALQVQLQNKMRLLILLNLLSLLFFSCSEKKVIPSIAHNADSSGWKTKLGTLYYNDVLYSGKQYVLYPSGDTSYCAYYYEGEPEGTRLYWYTNRKLKEQRFFVNGKEEGVQKGWYENGKQSFEYNFKNDVYEGSCFEWYQDGNLSKHFQYKDGHENGRQIWRNADGSLRANYEVRNGKIYGNMGTKNCASPRVD
jgi:antitoxin component YwqK of YwqJK toxin-antitoxin module